MSLKERAEYLARYLRACSQARLIPSGDMVELAQIIASEITDTTYHNPRTKK